VHPRCQVTAASWRRPLRIRKQRYLEWTRRNRLWQNAESASATLHHDEHASVQTLTPQF